MASIAMLFPSLFFLAVSPAAAVHTPPPFKKIYAFGDSYTDTGNTRTSTGPIAFNYVSNPPYGLTYFHHPTNRYSDGRIVIDFVAESLSLPLLPPYRNSNADKSHGVCYAVAGATAIRHAYFLQNNITFTLVPESLETQLLWFNKTLKSHGCDDIFTTPNECKDSLSDALIWVGEMGANDYSSTIGSSFSSKTIRTLAVNSVAGFIQAVINKGARYIAVQGLPPVGCVTYSFSLASSEDRDELGCVASVNRRSMAHNAATKASIMELRRRNPGTMIVYMDYYNAHLTVLKNTKGFGFTEMYKACCGYGGGEYNFDVLNVCGTPTSTACSVPSEYINWDGAHFTEAMNKVLAESFLTGSFSSPRFEVMVEKKLRSG